MVMRVYDHSNPSSSLTEAGRSLPPNRSGRIAPGAGVMCGGEGEEEEGGGSTTPERSHIRCMAYFPPETHHRRVLAFAPISLPHELGESWAGDTQRKVTVAQT